MQLETPTIYPQEVTRRLKEVVMRGTNMLVKLVTQAFYMPSPTIYHIFYFILFQYKQFSKHKKDWKIQTMLRNQRHKQTSLEHHPNKNTFKDKITKTDQRLGWIKFIMRWFKRYFSQNMCGFHMFRDI